MPSRKRDRYLAILDQSIVDLEALLLDVEARMNAATQHPDADDVAQAVHIRQDIYTLKSRRAIFAAKMNALLRTA